MAMIVNLIILKGMKRWRLWSMLKVKSKFVPLNRKIQNKVLESITYFVTVELVYMEYATAGTAH